MLPLFYFILSQTHEFQPEKVTMGMFLLVKLFTCQASKAKIYALVFHLLHTLQLLLLKIRKLFFCVFLLPLIHELADNRY